jgi:hypothetical protein
MESSSEAETEASSSQIIPTARLSKKRDPSVSSSDKTSQVVVPKIEVQQVTYEIQRLILSPSEYRCQPVCYHCESVGTTPGDIKLCKGTCGRWFHPACIRPLLPGRVDIDY